MDELRRRTFLALMGAPLLAALLEACGDEPATPAEVGSTRSQLARVATAPTDATAAATATNGFGMSLYRQLAKDDPTGNIVTSPVSIDVALTMTAAGARGTTLDEMIATLHISDTATIHHSMNSLTAQLEALSQGDVRLSIANSLWGQSGLAWQQGFLDLLAGEYGAGMELVDFGTSPESARLAINQWVSVQTQARIDELLARGIIDNDTKLVLVNAIYLKAEWAQQFDVALTADAPFTTGAGEVVQVPTMARTTQFAYATGDGWQAVELPYAGSSLAMLVFVPEDGFLPLFEEIFLITDATQYLAPRQVRLHMPRFDIEWGQSLKEQLIQLGMPRAFTDDADFSGMTTEADLRISDVVHQANITVTEEGTEAAAATAVVEATSAAPVDEPIELLIDRPFVFVLRDTATGAALFMGRVSDPRG